MADTTIVIDADAAKYLASLAKADQANKKAQKSAAGIGDGLASASDIAEGLVGQVVSLGSKTALVAAAGQAVTATWDNWISRLEKAQKLMEATTKGLQKAAAPSGANVARLRTDLLNQGGTLTLDQKTQAAAAYAGTAPQATDQEILKATQEANLANQAGLDATDYARNRAKLRGLGDQAGDITAQVMSQGGDQAGQMVEILQTIATRLSPEQAKNAVGLVTGSGQTPGGTALLGSMLGNFLTQGRKGDFAAEIQGSTATSLAPGLENRSIIDSLRRNAATGRSASLQGLASTAQQDAITRAQILKQESDAALEANNLRETASSAIRTQAENTLADAYAPNLPQFLRPRMLPTMAADLGYDFPLDPRAAQEAQRYRSATRAADQLDDPQLQVLMDIRDGISSTKRLSSSNGEPR